MTDKGIIFSAPMVRALLEGRKTQTRRLLKAPNDMVLTFVVALDDAPGWFGDEEGEECFSARYQPGQRLYVRESCAIDGERKWYRLGHEEELARGPRVDVRWRPSIHMPRSASRLWLAVTDVRVQRLHDCSEIDILAEGAPLCEQHRDTTQDGSNPYMCVTNEGEPWATQSPRAWYHRLWDTLHTVEGERWDDNPWVVAVSFDVNRGNIDQVQA